MRKIIILLFSIVLLNSCLVPPAPKRDYYKLAGDEKGDFVEASGGYVYKKDKYILNLWVFSTPKWKFMYLNTNLPVDDSIKIIFHLFISKKWIKSQWISYHIAFIIMILYLFMKNP